MPKNKRLRCRVRKTDAAGRPVGTLSFPTDPAVDKKLRDAGKIGGETARKAREAAEKAGQIKTVKAGEWCDDVPEGSRAWLLEQGLIEQVEVSVPAPDLQHPQREP